VVSLRTLRRHLPICPIRCRGQLAQLVQHCVTLFGKPAPTQVQSVDDGSYPRHRPTQYRPDESLTPATASCCAKATFWAQWGTTEKVALYDSLWAARMHLSPRERATTRCAALLRWWVVREATKCRTSPRKVLAAALCLGALLPAFKYSPTALPALSNFYAHHCCRGSWSPPFTRVPDTPQVQCAAPASPKLG